jgi:hypothetical protein
VKQDRTAASCGEQGPARSLEVGRRPSHLATPSALFHSAGCRERLSASKEACVSTLFGIVTIAILVMVPTYLVWMTVKSIGDERRSSNVRKVWANFALSIVLCALFFITWAGQGFAEWRTFVQNQHEHNQPVVVGEFVMDFGQSTLENWQSEFLQLFSFVVLAAIFIHRGSAESKDSDDRMEAKLDRIVKKLDA